MPYANGPIHIGHLVEYIQTDIFVRFLKLKGLHTIYCCADDSHGTAIEINASKAGISPEKFIEKWHKEHTEDFKNFHIHFDNYYTTNSPENRHYSDLFFNILKSKGHIYTKETEHTYCEHCRRFLPDRYVKGKCPVCGEKDQYGDVCEKCNSTYKTIELVDPYCTICGNRPVRKLSKHYYFKLSDFSEKLKIWVNENKELQKEVVNFINTWIEKGLEDWCISRDGPYFGFKIPGEENKYYYVWLDAPIGYIASTENYCKKHKEKAEDYWKGDKADIIHFIGKDIIYFHFLFWPAMLLGTGFNLPKKIAVHGFLTVNKEKMSKSRGTFLTAKDYLNVAPAEFLRFYYAANLTSRLEDIDLDLDDFKERINTELVGNIANFVYRVLSFANKNFECKIGKVDKSEIEKIKPRKEKIEEYYHNLEFREAVKEILAIADFGNQYFQKNEPWKLIKEDKEKAHVVVSTSANIVKDLSILLKPILPLFAEKIEHQLNKKLAWKDLEKNLENHQMGAAEIIFKKIEQIDLIHEVKEVKEEKESKHVFPFNLRAAKIISAENHPDAEKLAVLQIELGTEKRQIVAGLRQYYKTEDLPGKTIVVVTNLKPAKLRGIESNGMLLAADDGKNVVLVELRKSIPGDKILLEGHEINEKEITFDEFNAHKLLVKNKKVTFENIVLKTAKEELYVDIKDGSRVR